MRSRSVLDRGRRAAGRRLRAAAARALPRELAASALLAALRSEPEWVPPGATALDYELSQRLRRLPDERGGNRWLHHRWLAIHDEMRADLRSAGLEPATGCSYLCLGPGDVNPYAFSLLVFLAGAEDVVLVEPAPAAPGEEWRELWGLQELVLRLRTGSIDATRYGLDVSRLDAFVDVESLFFGPAGRDPLRRERVRMVRSGLEAARLEPGSVDLVSSRSVLEHVSAFDAFADALAEAVRTDGVVYHDVDLTAHSESGPFAFYYDAAPASGLNELRLSDHVEALERRGFETTVLRTNRAEASALDRNRLAERFRRYDDDDLLTTRAVIVARRSGGARLVA